MADRNNVILFGDQTVDPYSLIKQLYRKSRKFLTLQVLFQQTSDILRQELSALEHSDRALFPSFDSILSLAEAYSQSKGHNEAISTVLHCIAQIGLLFM